LIAKTRKGKAKRRKTVLKKDDFMKKVYRKMKKKGGDQLTN
jgi:hypothetical protein